MKRLFAILFVLTLFMTSMSAQNVVNTYAYNGKFKNTKITVSIWFEENTEGIVSGEIVYTSSKHKTPMRIIGRTFNEDGNKHFYFNEFQKDGFISGHLEIIKDFETGALNGTWNSDSDPDKPASYNIVLTKVAFPKGKGGTFTYSSDPAGKYSYTYHHFVKGDMGGSVEINLLRGNVDKMMVSFSKYDPQLAEWEENLFYEKGVFHGSIESCDITYDVHVFKDFVWVVYTSDGDGLCGEFGAFTTLEGLYPKVEE